MLASPNQQHSHYLQLDPEDEDKTSLRTSTIHARRQKPLSTEYTALATGYTVQSDRRDILKLKNSGLAFFPGV